jgi:hypothetical protein
MTAPVLSNSRVLVDRIRIPRRRPCDDIVRFGTGVDFGSDGIALVEVRNGEGQIVRVLGWFAGCRTAVCGVRGFGQRYVPARLKISWADAFEGRTLHDDGGRLTRALLDAHAEVIDSHFGPGTTDQIDIRRTLLIADG